MTSQNKNYTVNVMNSQADRDQAQRILNGSGSGSSSGSGSGSGSSSGGSGSGSSSGNVTVEDLTAQAESQKLEPINNVANDYRAFWGKQGKEEHRITGNTTSVRIYISKQRLDSDTTRITPLITKKEEDTDKLKKDTEGDKAVLKEPTKQEETVHESISFLNE